MDKTELITMSPLVLAYLGDTVYESYIREHLIRQNINRKVNDLHKSAIQYSKAKAQATIIHELQDELTEEEIRIFKRGRNQKPHTSPKNADIIDGSDGVARQVKRLLEENNLLNSKGNGKVEYFSTKEKYASQNNN